MACERRLNVADCLRFRSRLALLMQADLRCDWHVLERVPQARIVEQIVCSFAL